MKKDIDFDMKLKICTFDFINTGVMFSLDSRKNMIL